MLSLLDRGMQPNSNIATRAIGYRQALEFMQVGRRLRVAVRSCDSSRRGLHCSESVLKCRLQHALHEAWGYPLPAYS